MKFLIVNDFRGSTFSLKAFRDFVEAIKKVNFSHRQSVNKDKLLVDTETVYFVVNTAEELKQFLFQPDIGYTKIQAGKSFDLIDIVLINGDFRFKPWSHENLEIFTLIRMCVKTAKPLFCAGGSMMSYYFLCASDLDTVGVFE